MSDKIVRNSKNIPLHQIKKIPYIKNFYVVAGGRASKKKLTISVIPR